eukprot:68203-Pelagomonas_calceolata.AAC.1
MRRNISIHVGRLFTFNAVLFCPLRRLWPRHPQTAKSASRAGRNGLGSPLASVPQVGSRNMLQGLCDQVAMAWVCHSPPSHGCLCGRHIR